MVTTKRKAKKRTSTVKSIPTGKMRNPITGRLIRINGPAHRSLKMLTPAQVNACKRSKAGVNRAKGKDKIRKMIAYKKSRCGSLSSSSQYKSRVGADVLRTIAQTRSTTTAKQAAAWLKRNKWRPRKSTFAKHYTPTKVVEQGVYMPYKYLTQTVNSQTVNSTQQPPPVALVTQPNGLLQEKLYGPITKSNFMRHRRTNTIKSAKTSYHPPAHVEYVNSGKTNKYEMSSTGVISPVVEL
jgi:hypothetical protein